MQTNNLFTYQEDIQLQDKHVLIVDDVISTGKTLNDIAYICKKK